MTLPKAYLAYALLLACVLHASSCSGARGVSDFVLVGSTPGGGPVKSLLAIPPGTKVDFIKWNLALRPASAREGTYALQIVFGEGQPNTLGFKNGGEKRTFEGEYTVSGSGGKDTDRQIYCFKSSKLPLEIAMAKLNDNIFHLLTPQKQLMVGNGGWSYTLNREEPIPSAGLPTPATAPTSKDGAPAQVVFDGRTPCQSFAAEHPEMKASPSCFKLKWRLVLNRDPVSHAPTTYTIRKVVDNIPRDVSGKWTIVNGTASNPGAVVYQLDPDKPGESISFLVGDGNVLFFLNKQDGLYVGNGDFSFTLNRRAQP